MSSNECNYDGPGLPDKRVAFAIPYFNRGPEANFWPSKENLQEEDALFRYILYGWLPEKPFITKSSVITAFGSCFAEYIITHLKKHGFNLNKLEEEPYVVRYAAEIVNTYTIAQQFEWSWNDKEFSEKLWHTREKKPLEYNKKMREATKRQFDKTDVFIITVGLSEIWYNKQTNEVYWKTPVKDNFDSNKHGFRLVSYQENVDNLNIIIKLIKKHRPNSSVILTVSPIPLIATFRPVSCITANCVSKSILRTAVDNVVTSYGKENNVYYWPAYEIIKEYVENPFGEPVHPKQDVIEMIMEAFAKYYVIKE